MHQRINNLIDGNKEEMVSSLIELLKIPSVTGCKEEVDKSMDFTLNLARSLGLKTKELFDKKVGIIEYGTGNETLGILTHLDVVPAGEVDKWMSDPFNPIIKDGKIYARGTQDDKGPVISALYALYFAKELNNDFKKKVKIIVGTQEEATEWSDIDEYVEKEEIPDYGFTPDGEFPICNIEKGLVNLKIAFPRKKDANNIKYLKSIDGGEAINTVPGGCQAVLVIDDKEVKINTIGKSVHSCLPARGENAIINMCKIIKNMNMKGDLSNICCKILEKLAAEDCSGIGLKSKTEFYNGEYVHINCISPTIIETKEKNVILSINFRFVYGLDPDNLYQIFEDLARELGGEICEYSMAPAIYIDKTQPYVKKCMDAYEAFGGERDATTLEYGGSYAKAMPNIFGWGPVFPGEDINAHRVNEFINIDSFIRMTKIFTKAIMDIVSEKESLKK